jgi:tetratricopeptide (TPR) repeat protein
MTAETQSPRRGRVRDPRLAPYIENARMHDVFLLLSEPRYAGDEPNPRPLPQTSLHQFKQRVASGARSGTGPVPDALHFAFAVDRYRMPAEEAIMVPAEHLWWLACEGDGILLSDRVTHHYTAIGEVDREHDRIRFFDLWPEQFFLSAGNNTLGIAADRLSITKAEFLRVAVGLVTWDTPQLVQQYFTSFSEQGADADVLLRFGLAMLDADANLLAPLAAKLFAASAQRAEDVGEPDIALISARQAFLAAACGMYFANMSGQAALMDSMKQLLMTLISRHGRETLESGLSRRELARFANDAYFGRDFDTAGGILDRAIAKYPDFEDAFWLRARLRHKCGKAADAVPDAKRALELNDVALAGLRAERAAIDPRGKIELEWQDKQIGGRQLRRESELEVLVDSYLALGDLSHARHSAGEMITSRPDRAVGHYKIAEVEYRMGHRTEAVAALEQALARVKDPRQRSLYEQTLRQIATAS